MYFITATIFAGLVAVVNAHFQLQYPAPRGVFVEDNEPTFCDGYNSAVSNRTVFPLSNGVIELNSEHPVWTVGVILSTIQNPTSFNNFTEASNSSAFQMVMPFNQQNGEGLYCLPLDLNFANISGAADGSNVTIQIVFDGGDGTLYQCADLTLSSSASVPSSATSSCSEAVNVPSGTSEGVAPTASSTSPSSSTSSSAAKSNVVGMSGLLGLVGAVLAAL